MVLNKVKWTLDPVMSYDEVCDPKGGVIIGDRSPGVSWGECDTKEV